MTAAVRTPPLALRAVSALPPYVFSSTISSQRWKCLVRFCPRLALAYLVFYRSPSSCAGAAGAQDIGNFNVVLSNGQLPSESSITHEGAPRASSCALFGQVAPRNDVVFGAPGMFNEHFFAVGSETEKPFSCQWFTAVSPDPLR